MRLPAIGKQALKHTNTATDANLLWDNASFVLGIGKKGRKKLASFEKAVDDWFAPVSDPGIGAVLGYLREAADRPEFVEELLNRCDAQDRESLASGAPVVALQLHGDLVPICQRPAIRNAYEQSRASRIGASRGDCLVTGERDVPIAISHVVIKNVWKGKSSGAPLVSFNCRAFESYGKDEAQGLNAPVSESAAFAYTTALNHLLGRESRYRLQIGDSSTVIWAQRADDLEDALPLLFGETGDDPGASIQAAKKLFGAVESGRLAGVDGENRFYVLGLAPNAARIAVRFWYAGPLRELAPRVLQHFEDLRITRPANAPEHLSLFRLLIHCAVQRKADNIPPLLAGDIVRAVFAGESAPYPRELLNAAVNRCRAEQDVPYPRAAVLKAWLNRNIRVTRSSEKEFTPMLDPDNPSVAYRLGRLFAALEKIQEEAQPGINATIRERYYGAASTTPVAVFTTLLRLKNHHLAKLTAGRKTQFEKLLGEVLSGVNGFPAHLNLPDQGRFALGYYHQRQAFFTKSTDKE